VQGEKAQKLVFAFLSRSHGRQRRQKVSVAAKVCKASDVKLLAGLFLSLEKDARRASKNYLH